MNARISLILASVLLVAPLYGQSSVSAPKPAMKPMMPMKPMAPPDDEKMTTMMNEMMPKMDVASISLRLRESLGLSPDQVSRLTTMQSASQAAMQQHMMMHMQGMQAADVLSESATPDLAVYEAKLRESANHMVLAHVGMARSDADARAVLTPIQRDQLLLARRVIKEMHAGMMAELKAGMMKDSMMKDGMMKASKDGAPMPPRD